MRVKIKKFKIKLERIKIHNPLRKVKTEIISEKGKGVV